LIISEKPAPTPPLVRNGDGLAETMDAALGAEYLAAAAAARRQYAAAVLGRHTGPEAMHLAALAFLGLIGTDHLGTLLDKASHG